MPRYVPPLARKQALDVEPGGFVSSYLADTVGRVNPLSWPSRIVTDKAFESPRDPDRARKHKRIARLIERVRPEELEDTVVRLGGGDLVDDVVWKRERGGKSLPWYQQLGGRAAHNSKTSLPGKLLHWPKSLLTGLLAPLARQSHYNPGTDAISIYQDDPVVTQHELGHAIDDARLTGKPSKHYAKRQLQGAGRDIHSLVYGNLLGRLEQEATANVESGRALEDALKDQPEELSGEMRRRWKVLPAAYGSMLGIPAATTALAFDKTRPYALPIGLGASVLGALVGKGLGYAVAPRAARAYREPENA